MGEHAGDRSGRGRQRELPRRALLTGGLVGAAGIVGIANRDRLSSWWWRYSGANTPRVEGEVDHPGAEWVPAASANYRRANRPRDYSIDRVVIHMPEADYAVTLRVFQDPAHGAATHYVVRSEDGHVAQLARELDVAYHAGHQGFNERSVGIEHEGWADQPEYLTDALYASSARLVAGICARHEIPIDREHIVGHNEVPEVIRICPGPHWDWDRYLGMVAEAARTPEPTPSESAP
ncbi:N-acetylmuramoyl-L-alanine amidase [Streptomyces profundus]|uniref:N-acetylmuramoyl-L-alanine amidase n=1 Tax=Streptomyces profundus TaxID=2867410 RepID=UPI001D168658|nr:N-acetylmuramoyl-L-alanine amidase [Streptomyces sp. MA3_2.13]UED86801.1 N-acetylmuramoyl-L-alanine amidase [Streptomyces sp. MA3_2.13]